MNEEELKALETRLGRKATDEELEAELERLATVAERAKIDAFLREVLEVGKRHGYALDAVVDPDAVGGANFSVDRRSEDGYGWGDDKILAAPLDTTSPYPTKAEREAAQQRADEIRS